MARPKFCPQCGASLSLSTDSGVCPRCAFQVALQFQPTSPPVDARRDRDPAFVPPKPSELQPFFPQLELLDLIGQGGMGAVYKARQIGLDRLVAVKILPPLTASDPAFAERFAREARALARLNHPNIVSIYDSGRAGDLYYFVMEYVPGVNLRQAIQSGELSAKEALAIIPQVCDALQYAHDEGIVHRDIKPENVLMNTKGQVKIADFGLARLLGKAAENFTLTGTQQVMGTPRYMAPEQLEGTHDVDHRADIYSLGVVFYEMLTGELPLGRFAPPSKKVQVDVRLDEVVLRTLEKEPDLRYQQAGDVKTAVQTISLAAARPPFTPGNYGAEYRSTMEILGLPLFHYATGIDPVSNRRRIARGVIAIGDQAIGILAIGGLAFGLFSVGGISIGGFSLGGISIGVLLALGGLSVSLGGAAGGLAIAPVAVGGCAIGYYVAGGAGLGVHPFSATARDALGEAFFRESLGAWRWWLPFAGGAFLLPVFLVLLLVLMKSGVKNFASQPVPDFGRAELAHAQREHSSAGHGFAVGCFMFLLLALLFAVPAALLTLTYWKMSSMRPRAVDPPAAERGGWETPSRPATPAWPAPPNSEMGRR